jgi:hypothetical protein
MMAGHASGGGSVEDLQVLLLSADDLTTFLDSFTGLIAERLSDGGEQVWCAVTLLRPKKATSVAASSTRARAVDKIRYGYGPCLTAACEDRTVHIADFRTDARWSDYARGAVDAGVLSARGVSFDLEDESATFDVYADRADKFDQTPTSAVEQEVALISPILRLALRMARQRDTAADLVAQVSRGPATTHFDT